MAGTGLQWTFARTQTQTQTAKAATHDMVIHRQKEKGSRWGLFLTLRMYLPGCSADGQQSREWQTPSTNNVYRSNALIA